MDKAESIKQTEAQTVEALKPCPFCGGKAGYFAPLPPRAKVGYGVNCIDCLAAVGSMMYGCGTEEEAREAWNTRTEQPKMEESRIVRSRP